MFYQPNKYLLKRADVNDALMELKGDLRENEAKISLAKFLRNNLGITVELLCGIQLEPFQEILLKGMFNSNYSMCVMGRGSGKCTSYSNKRTYVNSKEHGFITIQNLFPNLEFKENEYWLDIPSTYLWNGSSWQKTDKILLQKDKQCLTVKTRRGYELCGSTQHRVKTIDYKNGKCEIVWKKYEELTTDDYICISRNEAIDWQNNDENIDDAYLVGLLIGDGSYTEKALRVTLTTADQETIDFVAKHPLFTRTSPTKSKAKTVVFRKSFFGFIEKWGLKRTTSYFKEIPQKILQNKSLLKACLSGLMDTDGCINKNGSIEFCSTSIELAKQVHLSLLFFGIISTLSEKKTPSPFGKAWKVNISGKKDVGLFYENIGFRLSRKQNRLISYINDDKKHNSNLDVVPGAKLYLNNIKREHPLTFDLSQEWFNKIKKRSNQLNLTYETTEKYINFFNKSGIDKTNYATLYEIQDENFYFDKIDSITPSIENCIDFNIPNGACYWSNGFISHNTFLASIFCILQSIFEPNSKIMIAGPTFRTARGIFNEIERFSKLKNAKLLRDCFEADPSKRPDICEWVVNGGSIRAIPLNGEKIRGFRANILVIDEFLLVPEDLIKNVLMPFLASPQNLAEIIAIKKSEDELIKAGKMQESERMIFPNTSKMIGLSSASFTFENLYRTYKQWIDMIQMDRGEELKMLRHKQDDFDQQVAPPRYFVAQLAYNAVPEHMIDQTVVAEAKNGGADNASFMREYGAQFTDGSDSYFSARKMNECTVGPNESPCVQIFPKKGSKYILAIDPSFSDAENSDHFSMNVMETDFQTEIPTLVHNYVISGGHIKDHYEYFYYLYTHFKPELLIIDNAGWEFINHACQSEKFVKAGIDIKFLEFDSDLEDADYQKMLIKVKGQYNKQAHRIAIKQFFSQSFIRKANENLKNLIDCKKIRFASSLNINESDFDYTINRLSSEGMPFKLSDSDQNKEFMNPTDFIDFQDDWIFQTKKQCALIEVKVTPQGNYSFELPVNLKKDRTKSRVRRDSYTTLLLNTWGNKCYYDIMRTIEEEAGAFTPYFIGE